MNIKFSIIIPVYTTEKYVGGCIESILAQTYQNFEIILINDHSKDNSIDVLRRYENEYNNIKVIDLPENHGQTYARNIGMDLATGDFIMFIDSDDKIVKETLQTISEVIEKHPEVDLIKIKCADLNTQNFNEVIPSIEFMNRTIKVNNLLGYTWSMIWKRERIKDIRHQIMRGMCAEIPFNYMCFNECKYFYVLDKNFYQYNKNNVNSISKNINHDECIEIAKHIINIIENYHEWVPEFYDWIIRDVANICRQNWFIRIPKQAQFRNYLKANKLQKYI